MLISPYGGVLVDLCVAPEARDELRAGAEILPAIQLTERETCDLELLAVGGFSPLDGFMTIADSERVAAEMRLANGCLFPIPVTLTVDSDRAVALDREIALRTPSNELLAIMRVEEVAAWDRRRTAALVAGTTDARHPLVAEMEQWGRWQISGRVRVVQLPRHYDFARLRLTPSETRRALESLGGGNVVAFQTRNPMHRAHEELMKRAMSAAGGVLLLHPSIGMTKPGDVDHFTRVRTYECVARHWYKPGTVVLSLLPLAMRMAGPREAVWHALIRRNYGANYFIVGRDHASPGVDSTGRPFYGPYDAQALVERCTAELGVTMVPFMELVFLPDESRYEERSAAPPGARTLAISGTQVRDAYLNAGRRLPAWFTRPEVADILEEAYPPKHRQGCVVWFTGLSGSGKSTTARLLVERLLEHGRQSTYLDGDIVRTHLSKGLGFSREDRDANVLRIGFVASEIARHGGIAICAAVSPYRATRDAVRSLVRQDGFIEVFVDTPLDVCEARDSKGLYRRARAGEIREFTGISDPYEPPIAPEVRLETERMSAEENTQLVLDVLRRRGFVRETRAADEAARSWVLERPSCTSGGTSGSLSAS